MDLNKPADVISLSGRHKVHAIWTYLLFPTDGSDKQVSLLNMPYRDDHCCPEDIIAEHNVVVEFIINDKLPLGI